MPDIDVELCPQYVKAPAFVLGLSDPTQKLRALLPASITVDYSACDPEGPKLPIELLVIGPGARSFRRRVFTLLVPTEFVVTPTEGGGHSVLLREVGHNYWHGQLTLEVEGDRDEPPAPR